MAIIVASLLACYLVFRQEGRLEIATGGVELRLGRASFGETTLRSSEGPVSLPARAYTPRGLMVRAHAADDTWQLTSGGPWGDLARIKVTPGTTTSLAVGPPLRIAPRVDVTRSRGYVELRILGRSGEKYSNVVLKNGRRMPAPRLKVLDRDGKVLASGRFAYG